MTQEQTTDDERAGIVWWNGMSEPERAQALSAAGTAVVAQAWAHYKKECDSASIDPAAR